jgi:hypothetical protein
MNGNSRGVDMGLGLHHILNLSDCFEVPDYSPTGYVHSSLKAGRDPLLW